MKLSNEDEVVLHKAVLHNDTGDEFSMVKNCVQILLDLEENEVNDQVLLAFQSKQVTQYYVGGVLENIQKDIKYIFMLKKELIVLRDHKAEERRKSAVLFS